MVATNWRVNDALLNAWMTPNQSNILARHIATRESIHQKLVSLLGSSHHHQPSSSRIQTMHNTRPQSVTNRSHLWEKCEHTIDHRAGRVARTWVHHHSRCLVDYGYIRILIHNVKQNSWIWLWQLFSWQKRCINRHLLTLANLHLARGCHLTVNYYSANGNECCSRRPTDVGNQ